MVQTFTNFGAEEASGIGALGFDGKAFLIQLVTFGLAYLVLRRYAFAPILKVLRDRRETIERSVELTESLQKEQTELEEKVQKILRETRAEADALIAAANDEARQAIRAAEDKARDKAKSILDSAEARISQDTMRARKQLEKELVSLVSAATEAIIEEKVDAKKDAALISKALKEARVS